MSEPIRSASVSPFATARPQVHSRRVSLRVGAFGLTYSTDRLLWNAEPSPNPHPNPHIDPPPVDPAPAVESERPQTRPEAGTFPPDLEAARRQAQQWAYAQEQAARQQTLDGQAHGQQTGRQELSRQDIGGQDIGGQTAQAAQQPGSGPVAGSQGKPDPSQNDAALAGQAQARRSTDTFAPGTELAGGTLPNAFSGGARTGGAGAQPGPSRAERALTQAMRQAAQAYRACQASFACPRPMLQVVA